jgi:hypothetical protein
MHEHHDMDAGEHAQGTLERGDAGRSPLALQGLFCDIRMA